jgi:hypothetical protein
VDSVRWVKDAIRHARDIRRGGIDVQPLAIGCNPRPEYKRALGHARASPMRFAAKT